MAVAAEPEPAAAGAEEPAAAAAGAEEAAIVGLEEPDAAEEEPLELQAAAPMARVSARPDTARSWCFTVISPVCLFVEPSGDGHHD
jgi:hypothetical protein